MRLVDLVEWRWSIEHKAHIKVRTHLTNVLPAIAIGQKRKILFHTPRSLSTRFTTKPNGTYQYVNQFKSNKKVRS